MRKLLDILSQLSNNPMTLGSNKTFNDFSRVFKNGSQKRKSTEDMNGFGMSDDNYQTINFNDNCVNQRHESNNYETPSKRSRIEISTNTTMNTDLNTNTQRSQKKGLFDFMSQKWDIFKRKFQYNQTREPVVQPSVDNSVIESTITSETNTNPVIESIVPVLDHKKRSFFSRQRRSLAEKMKYKSLLARHSSQQIPEPKSVVTFHKPIVTIDLTSSADSLVSKTKPHSDHVFTSENLDLTTKADLIDRIKSKGLTSPVHQRANSSLNFPNHSLFGQKSNRMTQSFGIYSTPKVNQFSNTLIKSDQKTPEPSQSLMSPIAVPESSKKFTDLCQTKNDLLSPRFASDLLESLNKSYEYSNQKLLKKESILSKYKDKREADSQSISYVFKTPITRAELLPFTPFIGFDDKIEEEEEEDEEEEEESSPTEFPVLTDDMRKEIASALVPNPPNEVLSEGFLMQICRKDMETLKGLNWLNDEIINFYMSLIMERGKNDNYSNVHAFNTFFYKKLKDNGPKSLMRWTRKIDVFDKDFIFIPIHLGMHWCLAVINFVNKKIEYYDSMGGDNYECVQSLKSWLQAESLDKKKREFPMTEWTLQMVKDIPQQMNGSDCGMFTCKYAEYISRKAKINFSQAHMPYFRSRMVYEILTKQLL